MYICKSLLFLALLCCLAISAEVMDKPLNICFIRHGQAAMPLMDVPEEIRKNFIALGLTPAGRKQALLVGQYLHKNGFKGRIFASMQERAAETANIISKELGLKYVISAQLREISGRIVEPIDKLFNKFEMIEHNVPINITPESTKGIKEDKKQVTLRGLDFISGLLNNPDRSDVVIVTHGYFIACIVSELLKSKNITIPWNCGMVELQVQQDLTAIPVKLFNREILPPELITDNNILYATDPFYKNFRNYGNYSGHYKIDVNEEFKKLINGQLSSWSSKNIYRPEHPEVKNGTLHFSPVSIDKRFQSVIFPVPPAASISIKLRVSGHGNLNVGFDAFDTAFNIQNNSKQKTNIYLPEHADTKELTLQTQGKTAYIRLFIEADNDTHAIIESFNFNIIK